MNNYKKDQKHKGPKDVKPDDIVRKDVEHENTDQIINCRIKRFKTDDGWSVFDDAVVRESFLRIKCNCRELAIISYLPGMEREFACGYLLVNGLVSSAEDIYGCEYNSKKGEVITAVKQHKPKEILDRAEKYVSSGCGGNLQAEPIEALKPLSGPFAPVAPSALVQASHHMQSRSEIFKLTGGIHSVVLCNNKGEVIVCAEDIGRHNAFDKVVGYCLLNKSIRIDETFVVCTGRLSSEIVIKAWRIRMPLVVSRSAPTSRAIELARKADIALVGFARGRRFNIYHGEDRIQS